MAEADYFEEYERAPRDFSSAGVLFNVFGAVLSLGLIGGVAWWGYDLTARDVSGIPVVQALEGPMRDEPENPGGTQARHQGLSVNAVQAEGQAEPAADSLTLAPPPISITENDAPVHDVAYTREVSEPTPAPVFEQMLDSEDEVARAIAEEVLNGMSDAEEEVAAAIAADEAGAEQDVAVQIIPENVPGVVRSPRPVHRPDVPVAANEEPPSIGELPVGTSLVQLGAFDSQLDAMRAWEMITLEHRDYFIDKQPFIEEANTGNRIFFRLRTVGFADIADARRFCAALVAEGTDCIPTAIR